MTDSNATCSAPSADDLMLEVRDLRTYFDSDEGTVKAVDGVSFELGRGETLAIVGESGSGKTVTSLSVLALLPKTGKIEDGSSILFEGRELVGLPEGEMQKIRGAEIAMIFQDPLTALNPVYTVGNQLIEAIRLHQDLNAHDARELAIALLERAGIPEPAKRIDDYPHQLSGGMRQRAMIAMALSCCQKILIADEPTTALDATIQAQILALMEDLQREIGISIILITHDLGVVAEMADRVLVMYGGRKVEYAEVHELFAHSMHPYTWGLLRSLPRLDADRHSERLLPIPGVPPSLIHLPPGCHFYPRCRFRQSRCETEYPQLREVTPNHWSACHFAETLKEHDDHSPDLEMAEVAEFLTVADIAGELESDTSEGAPS
jgi:peptide/nickel transport system ATP-binding protein